MQNIINTPIFWQKVCQYPFKHILLQNNLWYVKIICKAICFFPPLQGGKSGVVFGAKKENNRSIMTENIIYTPSNLFSDIDFELDSSPSVIKESEKDGVKIKEIYFSAREINGKRTRGYGMLALNSVNSSPLLVIIGDICHGIDEDYITSLAMQGFSVFSFDYSGEDDNKTKYTFYPKEIDYANFIRSGRHLNHADTDARSTCLFEWTTLSHYAVTAALSLIGEDVKAGIMGVGRGADIVWMLSSFDKRYSACCTVFSAGWDAYKNIYKYSDDNSLKNFDEERERWLAAISAESYAKFISSPMLFLSSTNSVYTHIERAYDTISRIPENIPTHICVSAGLCENVSGFCSKNIILFFNKYLKEDNITLPKKASAEIVNEDGIAKVKITAEDFDQIESVNVHCAEGKNAPQTRNWYTYNGEKSEDGFFVKIKINYGDLIFAYANITYKNNFTQSTNISVKSGAELGFSIPQPRRSPVIYSGEMGTDSFVMFSPKTPSLKEVFLSNESVRMKKGTGCISGVTAQKGLATYKISEKPYSGTEEESFKFDVHSPQPQELTIYFSDKAGTKRQHFHFCKIKLMGGNIWHPVEIKKQNLKTEEGHILKSWEDVSMVGFYAENEFLLNNILWI